MTEPEQEPAESQPALASDAEVYRRALLVVGVGALILAALVGIRGRSIAQASQPPVPSAAASLPDHAPALAAPPEAPAKQRARLDQRLGRCGPLDPTTPNHFAEPRELSLGRAWIPKTGGHDPDFGYEIVDVDAPENAALVDKVPADILEPRRYFEKVGRAEDYKKWVAKMKSERREFLGRFAVAAPIIEATCA